MHTRWEENSGVSYIQDKISANGSYLYLGKPIGMPTPASIRLTVGFGEDVDLETKFLKGKE